MTQRRTVAASPFVLAALALGALLLVVAGAHVRPSRLSVPRTTPRPVASSPAPSTSAASAAPDSAVDGHGTQWLVVVVIVVLLVFAALGLAAVGHVAFRLGRGWRWPALHAGSRGRRPARAEAVQLTDELRAVVDDALRDLETGPVANTIVACWQRLEDTVTGAGVRLRSSDTPAEVVLRVLGSTPARSEPLQRLAGLYREARFSRHPMGDVERRAAQESLAAIRADLATTVDLVAETGYGAAPTTRSVGGAGGGGAGRASDAGTGAP